MSSPAPDSVPRAALSSFRELYDAHFDFTWRTLRYLGVAGAQLDDAVQEVWVAVCRRLGDFEGRSDIKTWLFGIAINVQRNMYRSERRRSWLPLPPELAAQVGDPMLEREGREAWELVLGFLDTLDDTRRAVFVASLLEGMSPSETAEATGLDLTTVYHRMSALRRSFRAWAAARGESP